MKALTANRLADGEVVFWSGGRWVERFGEAEVFADEADARGAEAAGRAQITDVIDPYLIDLVEAEGGCAPASYRERLRALGPSNTPQHGKQAARGEDVERIARADAIARSGGRFNLIKRK